MTTRVVALIRLMSDEKTFQADCNAFLKNSFLVMNRFNGLLKGHENPHFKVKITSVGMKETLWFSKINKL